MSSTNKRRAPRFKMPDARLQPLAERAAKVIELAMEKVVAHHVDPKKYPLPPGTDTVESSFKRLFDGLTPARKKGAAARLTPRFRANDAERNRLYGDLNKVDLKLPVSVIDQARKLPIPKNLQLSKTVNQDIDRKLADLLGHVRVAPQAAVAVALESRLIKVTCVKDTKEKSSDEMAIGGLAVDELGNVSQIPVVSLGQFKSGDSVEFPAPNRKRFFLYNLTQGAFPKTFVTAFILAEIDHDTLAKVLLAISVALQALFLAGLLVANATGNLTIGLIALIVGALALVAWIIGMNLLDDTFEQILSFGVGLDSNAATFTNGQNTITQEPFLFIGFDGAYQVEVDYRLLTQV